MEDNYCLLLHMEPQLIQVMYLYTVRTSNSEGSFMDREQLDRRCLQEAHMRFCMLDVFKRYPQTFSTRTISSNLQQSLDDITPLYYNAFAARYAG